MGVEPYLVAATLRLVVSQRLVRKLCLDCRHVTQMGPEECRIVEKRVDSSVVERSSFETYAAQGCKKCNGTGYFGRTVVAEVLPITEQLKRSIVEKHPITPSLLDGMKTISYQAVMKYVQGVTSFEEVVKILHE
jgi:type II secretory ATPase GspE/PulE/Tfp pilus assembly ATPase PilB-like protein